MRPSVFEQIFKKHFGARAEPIVESFITSPAMQGVLDEMDAAQVERRRAIILQLESAPARHEAGCRQATKALELAKQAETEARAVLEASIARHMEAMSTAIAAGHAYEQERARLQRELERSADPRLELFAQGCTNVAMTLRHLHPKQQFTGKRVVLDYTSINAAMTALREAAATARALKLQALSFAEITGALDTLRQRLQPLLTDAGYCSQAPATDGSDADALALH